MTGPLLVLHWMAPNVPLSENASRRLHWAARNRRLHPWRDAARFSATATPWNRERVRLLMAHPVPVTIDVALPFRDKRRRDPHNYVGTNVKAVVDGLVLAGVIPDDNPEWATIREPSTNVRPPGQSLWVTVTITPREAADHGPSH